MNTNNNAEILSNIGSIFFAIFGKIVLKIIPRITGIVTIANIVNDAGINPVLNIRVD